MSNSCETCLLWDIVQICDNLDGVLSLVALADASEMSRFHWHRVYRAMTGETCAQTAHPVRLHMSDSLGLRSGRVASLRTIFDHRNPSALGIAT
jgi:AraC-like DNA-binding protein